MENGKRNLYLKEIAIGLALSILAVAVLLHGAPQTLNEKTYDYALALSQGASGAQALVQSQGAGAAPVLAMHSALYGISKPFLAGLGHSATPDSLIWYFIALPPVLLFAITLMLYASLRLWRFGRIESAAAVLLVSLGALSPLFYPGNFPPAALGVFFSTAGLLALVLSAYAKKEMADMPISWASAIIALLALSLGAYVSPVVVWIPLAILLAELVAMKGRYEELLTAPLDTVLRALSLLLPLAVIAASGGIPNLTWSLPSALALFEFAPFATGFAALCLLFLYWNKDHPRAVEFALLAALSFAAAGSSSGAGAVLLALPCAYGIKSYAGWKGCPPLLRALLATVPIVFAIFGLLGGAEAPMGPLANGVLASCAFFVVAFFYDWEGGTFARFGMLLLLVCGATMISLEAQPFRAAGMPELSDYQAVLPQTHDALAWIGKQNISNAGVAAFAPPSAVLLLAGASPPFANETAYAEWLAADANTTASALPENTLAVVDASVFPKLESMLVNTTEGWNLRAYKYLQTVNNQGAILAVFYSSDGLLITQQLDDSGNFALAPARIYAQGGNYQLDIVPVGQTSLLMPERPYNESGNLLLRPNKEYGSRVLEMFRNNQKYPPLNQNASAYRVVKIG